MLASSENSPRFRQVSSLAMAARLPMGTNVASLPEGPHNLQFERGFTGGLIVQTTKVSASTAAQLRADTNDVERATLDLNVPTDGQRTTSEFRINLMGNGNGVAEQDCPGV